MSINVHCEYCGKRFGVADEHAGKLIMCVGCKEAIRVGPATRSRTRTSPSGKTAVRRRPQSSPKPRRRRSREVPAYDDDEFAGYELPPAPVPRSTRSARARALENKRMLQLAACALLIVSVPGLVVFAGMKLYRLATAPTAAVANSAESGSEQTGTDEGHRDDKQSYASQSSDLPLFADPENSIDGDRVAWLDAAGNGYARFGSGWVYHGPADNVPFHSGSGELQSSLFETMRNDSLVELFDPASNARVRLTAESAVSWPKDSSSEFTHRGGTWKDSTEDAVWLARVSPSEVPQIRPVKIAAADRLQELIAAVEKNVVRVDVTSRNGSTSNGSGFLVDPSGRIVTNYHVIEGSKSASVVFKGDGDSKSIELDVAGFLHLDASRDVAVLQVHLPADHLRNLTEVRLIVLAGQQGNGRDLIMEGLLQEYIRQALQPNGVKLVLDQGPILLVIATVNAVDDLEMFAHLFVHSEESLNAPALRIWRNAGHMGRLTRAMKRRRPFLGKAEENIIAFSVTCTMIWRKRKRNQASRLMKTISPDFPYGPGRTKQTSLTAGTYVADSGRDQPHDETQSHAGLCSSGRHLRQRSGLLP